MKHEDIINLLEVQGCFTLAEEMREVLATKETRRKGKIEAINLAATIRDKIETITKKLLRQKIGTISDVEDLLEGDFDRLEDKFAKILGEYFEFKSNEVGSEENVAQDTNTNEEKFM